MADLQAEAGQVLEEVQLGWATWQTFGETLSAERERLEPAEGNEVLDKLIGDFLSELARRRLLKA